MCRASHPPQRARRNCCRKRTCSAGERSMTIREGTAGTRTTPKGGTSRCSKRPVRCATTHPITVRCSMWNDLESDTYAYWLNQLAEKRLQTVTAEMKANLLQYYRDLDMPLSTKRSSKKRVRLL